MGKPPARKKSYTLHYFGLAAVGLLSLTYQAIIVADLVVGWNRDEVHYGPPFSLAPAGRAVATLQESAHREGLRPGDEILAVSGRELRGVAQLVLTDRPEEDFTVRRGGDVLTLRLTMVKSSKPFSSLQTRLVVVVMLVLMPLVCLLLAVVAAGIRPCDPQAWLLLGLMLTFPNLVGSAAPTWSAAARGFVISYRGLMLALLPSALALFGIYFGERASFDRRWPWLKWLLVLPSVGFGFATVTANVLRSESLMTLVGLQAVLRKLALPFSITLFVGIAVFFFSLFSKYFSSTHPDVRRRLRLLLAGTTLALTPMFVLIIASLVTGKGVLDLASPGVLVAAILLIFLFPLTITYVIVVHRALNLRVVLRQGIQYTLARGGARLLIALLVVTVILGVLQLSEDPGLGRAQKLQGIAFGILAIVLIQRLRLRLAAWIDRHFFRQAYDAERVLSELSDEVRTIIDPAALMRTVGQRIAETLQVSRLTFLVGGEGPFRPAYALGYDVPPDVELAQEAATVRHLRATQQPARVYLDDEANWVWRTPEVTDQERDLLARLESELILPLSVREKLIGIISLGPKKSEEPYSGSDLRLLRSLASQSALALENSRLTTAFAREAAAREKLNRELEIAREVQERLFPQKAPVVEGVDCAGGCRPAFGVGGDYYDFLNLPDGRLGLVIGDVSGKGIAAALLMASLQASVRGQSLAAGETLAGVVSRVNSLIYESSTTSRYATLFYAQFDPRTLRLDYVNAGHNPPLLLRASGAAEPLDRGGTVIGLLPRFPYEQGSVQLHPGDLLVAFTDGVSEAMNPQDEEWGEDRLLEAVRGAGGLSAAEMIPYLIAQADEFAAGAPQHDDMTLVILRVLARS